MDGLLQDVRYAMRQLHKSPGFAAIAILVLTLGIAASTAIFGFVDAALIRPLPYKDPERLVDVTESAAMFPRSNLSYMDYADWKKLNQVFSSLEAYNQYGYLLRVDSGSEPVVAVQVTASFFRTLGVTPILGREFHDGEDQVSAPQSVILSYPTWQKRFGGRKDIAGTTVTLSGDSYTIIGVLPREFQFAPQGDSEFWTTLRQEGFCNTHRDCHNLYGIGRLKDGVSVATALSNLKTIAHQLEIQYPAENLGEGASVRPLAEVFVENVRADSAGATRRIGAAAIDCLRECIQFAAGPLRKPKAGDRGPGCDGSFAHSIGPPVHYRRIRTRLPGRVPRTC